MARERGTHRGQPIKDNGALNDGSENIARADALFTLRLHNHQATSVRYIWSRRAAEYRDLGDVIQSRRSFGLFYTYLTGSRFGAVDW